MDNPGDVIAFVFLMMVILGAFVVLGPIGRALADRLRGKTRERSIEAAEVESLRNAVEGMRHQVGELAERQDFTERLLAQARERGLLAAPRDKER